MQCRKCSRQIPPSDKYCVYCGTPTGPLPVRKLRGWVGRLPTWARLISVSVFFVSAGVLIAFPFLNESEQSLPTPTPTLPTPTPTSQNQGPLTSFQLSESVDLPIITPTVNSKYTTSIPTIDGVMTPSEWTEPAFTKTFNYSIGNISEVGELVGYFMNDDDNLYVAVTASAEDFREDSFQEYEGEGVGFVLELRFDGNNDGTIAEGEDVRIIGRDFSDNQNLRSSEYENGYFCGTAAILLCTEGNTNGAGNMSYPGDTNTFTYEFRIPLNSGNPGDLAVKPGDTVGLKVILGERQAFGRSYRVLESVGWPIGEGLISGGTYGKLVLAQKPIT